MAVLTSPETIDTKVRLLAFAWLEEQCQIQGESLPRRLEEAKKKLGMA